MKKEKSNKKNEQTREKQEGFVVRIFNFFNQYNKIIYGIAIGLLVVVAALMAINKFYLVPQSEKASALMTVPIDYYMKGDSLSLINALEGDEDNIGFLDIATSFILTNTSNTANYFAGMCYLKLGEKDEALNYLQKFTHKEDTYWYGAQALISDLYDDQGEIAKAIKYCKKAAESKDPYLGPVNLFKLGQLYERENEWEKAASAYQSIKDKFYSEYQKMNIDKFLERALVNKNK
ncbi:MAG: tetratricopeptide repeat protein [Bacteroidales bacterium]|jgi:tetratricopeptide (TPR) repeat protein|nr:tetratricopeptide repeat protein [Bacteroidales bacterium]